MASADGAATAVRQANARGCLLALRAAGSPRTLADLAEQTGLSRPTVDAVLGELTAAGSVRPVDAAPSASPGRPARRFTFDPTCAAVAAIDIGERSVQCLLADAAGTALSRERIDLGDVGPGQRLRAIEQVVRTCSEGRALPAAVGLAVPGILSAQGPLAQSLAVADLVGVDVAAELTARLGCEVAVENDIKLAAYAEHHLSPTPTDIAFVQIGHRISVALILDGQILQGRHRLAGELGTQRGMRWTRSSQRGRLRWSTGEDARALVEAAASGEQAAIAEIDEFCAQIAPRIASLVLTVDPEQVVIGGGLSRAGDTLLEPLRRHVHHLLTSPGKPELVRARLTTDGALIGALGLAFEHGSRRLTGVPGVPPPWQRFPVGPALPEAGADSPVTGAAEPAVGTADPAATTSEGPS